MGLFGFGKKKETPELSSDFDMDVPPKPPEFRVEGPAEPTSEELKPIEPLILTPPEKPTHTDDFAPAGLIPQPLPEVQQTIAQVQEVVPEELPALELPENIPLLHEEYLSQSEPAPKIIPTPPADAEHPLGESVLLRTEGPLFVTLEGYEKIVGSTMHVRSNIQHAEDRASSMITAQAREEGMYTRFQQCLEHVERKLAYIDRMLYGEAEE